MKCLGARPGFESCWVAERIGNLHLRGRSCSDHWGFTTKRKTAIINLAIGGEEWDLVRTHQAADGISMDPLAADIEVPSMTKGAFAYSEAPSDRLKMPSSILIEEVSAAV
jgi:hypothetical protein